MIAASISGLVVGFVLGYAFAALWNAPPLWMYWRQSGSAWVLVAADGSVTARVSPCVTGGYQDAFGWGHKSAEEAIRATNRKLRRIGS